MKAMAHGQPWVVEVALETRAMEAANQCATCWASLTGRPVKKSGAAGVAEFDIPLDEVLSELQRPTRSRNTLAAIRRGSDRHFRSWSQRSAGAAAKSARPATSAACGADPEAAPSNRLRRSLDEGTRRPFATLMGRS